MEYLLMLRTAHALGPDVRDNHAASASAARDSWQALGAAAAIIIFGQLASTFFSYFFANLGFLLQFMAVHTNQTQVLMSKGRLNRADRAGQIEQGRWSMAG